MVDMILENYSKAAESTLRLQQEMLRNWTMQWSPLGTQVFELPVDGNIDLGRRDAGSGMAGAVDKAQRKWAEAVADMLKRHQETLDEQYRAGIRAIDDAFRVGAARNPEQFHRWSRSCGSKTARSSRRRSRRRCMTFSP